MVLTPEQAPATYSAASCGEFTKVINMNKSNIQSNTKDLQYDIIFVSI
jgi:hypothetical protein